VSYKRQELLAHHRLMALPTVFGGVNVAHLFILMSCALSFVCFHIVPCVPYYFASHLLIFYSSLPLDFSNVYLSNKTSKIIFK
jgi:hypothetical protein